MYCDRGMTDRPVDIVGVNVRFIVNVISVFPRIVIIIIIAIIILLLLLLYKKCYVGFDLKIIRVTGLSWSRGKPDSGPPNFYLFALGPA